MGFFMPVVRMLLISVLFAALASLSAAAQGMLKLQSAEKEPLRAQGMPGPQGAEEEPLRTQMWLVPSPDGETLAHAVLFRPSGEGPYRLAVVAHASTQNTLLRTLMPQPEYRPLAAFLVARGFAVLVPERPGHGATGGNYLEDQNGCDGADYVHAGRATAQEISAALNFMRGQPFIRRDGAVVIGHSAGGWGALALSDSDPAEVSSIIAIAPGRGGQPNGIPNQICAPHTLVAAAGEFGRGARIPVTWLVSANDGYFSPEVSKKMSDAFRAGGGKVDFRVLPAYASEGHWMIETERGVAMAASELDRALKGATAAASKKP